MVKLISLLVIVILGAAVITAGCTEDEKPGLPLPAADVILPGQVLLNIGM